MIGLQDLKKRIKGAPKFFYGLACSVGGREADMPDSILYDGLNLFADHFAIVSKYPEILNQGYIDVHELTSSLHDKLR